MQNFCSITRHTMQNFCATVRDTMSNKNKKNRLNILRVKIKDSIVPFLNVQSIMCTLTRFNNQRSKKLNIYMSKMHLRLTFRWIIQNVVFLKRHIFLIRENWSILLLLHRRNFLFICLNSAALKPTFHLSGKKSTIFCGIDMKNIPKRSIFSRKMLFWKRQNSLESVTNNNNDNDDDNHDKF